MIRAAEFEPTKAPRLVGIHDSLAQKAALWHDHLRSGAWYRILELLPDRNADTVASLLLANTFWHANCMCAAMMPVP